MASLKFTVVSVVTVASIMVIILCLLRKSDQSVKNNELEQLIKNSETRSTCNCHKDVSREVGHIDDYEDEQYLDRPTNKVTIDKEDNRLTIDTEVHVPRLDHESVLQNGKFTVIIPTYKRVELLKRILDNYCKLSSHIDSIIVVWNNIEEPIPDTLKSFSCAVALYLKKETTNSLNNRFKPFPEIRTEAVLSADDDLLISHKDLIFQFETWQQFKHLIIGFAPRKHVEWPANSGSYIYFKKFSSSNSQYSFILTTSAMFHAQYLKLYQSQLTDEFRNFIDETMNCEDLLMNAIVAQYLKDTIGEQCPALLIKTRKIVGLEKENDSGYKGLWYREGHKPVRDRCLNMIAKTFKGLPFGYSYLKAVPA